MYKCFIIAFSFSSMNKLVKETFLYQTIKLWRNRHTMNMMSVISTFFDMIRDKMLTWYISKVKFDSFVILTNEDVLK